MILERRGERFREIPVTAKFRYAVSNHGRVVSFTGLIMQGRLLTANADGYGTFKINNITQYTYRWVAELFVEKPSEEHIHVIHLDYSRDKDHYKNLKWVTQEEKSEHLRQNPKKPAKRKLLNGYKLDETKAIRIKKLLNDPNRKTRVKIIAKQFGISEMQAYRIKRGECWGSIQ